MDVVIDRFDHSHCHECGCVLTNENRAQVTNYICKDCHNRKNREYKKRRRMDKNDSYRFDEQQRAKRLYRGTYRKKRDEFFNKYKYPCLKCGESHFECIVFHHVVPQTKSFSVAAGQLGKHTKEEIETEIKKCVCLCENCHRKFHHQHFYQIENPVEALKSFILTKGD